MSTQLTLTQIIAKLIVTECEKYVEDGGDVLNINDENDKETIATLVSYGDIEGIKFTKKMIKQMCKYLNEQTDYEIDNDADYTDFGYLSELFTCYSERFILNCSSEKLDELRKLGKSS